MLTSRPVPLPLTSSTRTGQEAGERFRKRRTSFVSAQRDADIGLSHRRRAMGRPCFLGFLLGFCFAALPGGSSACPKPCACYIPAEVHCTFRYLTAIPLHISQDVERINLGYVYRVLL
uniref:Uncharacterized protein n=1 Tax=Sphaerodactylus townsendi TaxID=933632 RepID=A0ACB8FB74_9SAUR